MDMFAGSVRSNPSQDPTEILADADALRDARHWTAAAAAYGAYLRLAPEAWPIRVQYGHCLKESGNPHAALVSYREADRQHPDDADVQLQIGHALKLLDCPEEAFEHYARALTLDPGNAAARDEVLAFETVMPAAEPVPALAPLAAPSPASPVALVFDASDLLDYFHHNRAPTGIQRVQLNIIREAVAIEGDGVAVGCFDVPAGAWKAVPQPLFLQLARLSREGTATADPAWQAAVGAVRDALQAGPPIAFAPGSCLVNLGTSWWIPDYLRVVRDAKARHGLRYIPFIHDCIPLIVPEHCAAELVDEFARWFAAVCLHADAVLVNSECTRADFIAAQRRLLPGLDIPCFQMPLDAADPPGAATTPPPLRSSRPYVLFVGTIESRKNHLLAFNAWLTLLRRHGPEAVPDLVCVGKQGWLAEAALRLHANSAALRGRVHLLHGVPDTELEALYRGCLFTFYNSFYEGWGLPVTESLAHGKVALVPEHSSLPEAGRHGAVFFTPQSEPDLVARLEQLMFDAGFRAAREAEVAAGPRPRRWADLAAQVQAHAEASRRTTLPAPRDRLAFRLGEVHPLRLLPGPEPSLAMAIADALREGPGWSRLESWGVWTTPGRSLLRLPVEAGSLRAYLELVAPPQAVRFGIRAGMRGSPPGGFREVEAAGREVLFCTLDVTAGAGGELEIEIDTGPGVVLPGDPRQIGIGVRSVMVCRRDDLASRLDYLERAALPRLVSA